MYDVLIENASMSEREHRYPEKQEKAGGGLVGKIQVLREPQVQYKMPKLKRENGDTYWKGPHLNFAHLIFFSLEMNRIA